MIKSNILLLSRQWLFLVLTIFSFGFISVFAIQKYRISFEETNRWARFQIEDYSAEDNSIDIQLERLQDELDYLEEQINNIPENMFVEEKNYYLDSIAMLNLLKERNIDYNDAIQGDLLGNYKDRRSFIFGALNIQQYLYSAMLVLLIYEIVCFRKDKGTIVIELIMYGRKKVFWEQFITGIVFIVAFWILINIFTVCLNTQFLPSTKWLAYGDRNGVRLIPVWIDYLDMYLFSFSQMLLFFLILFGMASFVTYSALYFLISAGLIFLQYVASQNDIFLLNRIFKTSIMSIFSGDISRRDFVILTAIKLCIPLLMLAGAYMYSMKKKNRTHN